MAGFCSPPRHRVRESRLFQLTTASAGAAGISTHLSFADRDLFLRDCNVVAANGAPAPSARIEIDLAVI
jgi:hypothetical protein